MEMEKALDAADLERSVVAKQMNNRAISHAAEVQAGWVIAERWREEEIDLLLRLNRLLWRKKTVLLKVQKEMKEVIVEGQARSELDCDDMRVFSFRKLWMEQWSRLCNSLESVTKILSMPFTYHPAPKCAYTCFTLQIYSAKIEGLTGGLELPLDVFGMIAVRDSVDRKRNIVFYRSRDNCQILTEKDPYLVLTGPTRAICLDSKTDAILEVDLKVRGKVESQDGYLSFLAAPLSQCDQCMRDNYYTSKCSTLMFTLARVESSVEATIFARSIEGSWPDGAHGQITANSFAKCEKVVLLDFGADNVPIVSGGGDVELSRHVVSVDCNDGLVVSCKAWGDDRFLAEQSAVFKVAAAGRSYATLQLGTCKLEIIVAWSLVSPEPDGTMAWC